MARSDRPFGVLVVGEFAGTGARDDGSFPYMLVRWPVDGRDEPVTKKIGVVAHRPDNGEATKVGEALSTVRIGDVVSVSVWVDLSSGAEKFVTYSARDIVVHTPAVRSLPSDSAVASA